MMVYSLTHMEELNPKDYDISLKRVFLQFVQCVERLKSVCELKPTSINFDDAQYLQRITAPWLQSGLFLIYSSRVGSSPHSVVKGFRVDQKIQLTHPWVNSIKEENKNI